MLRDHKRSIARKNLLALLLIVDVGILVAIVFPLIAGGHREGPNSSQSDITALAAMLKHFKLDCGRYPTSSEGFDALLRPPIALVNRWHGPYSDRPIPVDRWGNRYLYHSSGRTFEIRALGADGEFGGKGYEADLVVTDSDSN